MKVKVKFWGVRGSIATPGPTTVRYGGNTSCISYETDEGDIIILDAGTGIRELSFYLLPKGPVKADVLICHTHWDHIQGFPFFIPIYIPTTSLTVRAPVEDPNVNSIKDIMGLQLKHEFFPITAAMLEKNCAKIEYINLKEEEFNIGNVKVRTNYVKHPILSLGYRLEYKDTVVVYSGDNEPYTNIFKPKEEPQEAEEDEGFDDLLFGSDDVDDEEAEKAVEDMKLKLINFYKDADILICDGQYTPEEYKGDPEKKIEGKENWGHTPMDFAVDNATKAGAKKLFITHHEPTRSDDAIDELKKRFRQYALDKGSPVEINFAKEKEEIIID